MREAWILHMAVTRIFCLSQWREGEESCVIRTLQWPFVGQFWRRKKAKIFQQDGTSCHTAKDVIQWLDDCGVGRICDWPVNSPDISHIENLWTIIKSKIRSPDISTLLKHEIELRKCWEQCNSEHLQNLAYSIPCRLEKVIKRKGYATKY